MMNLLRTLVYIACTLFLLFASCGGEEKCPQKACENGQVCENGICNFCPVNKPAQCDGKCINLQTDSQNCGSCGKTCKDDQLCVSGNCQCDTSISCSGACVLLESDPDHCGGCGNKCSDKQHCIKGYCTDKKCSEAIPPLTDCDRACVDTKTSLKHCGSCSKTCRRDQVCNTGKCTCAAEDKSCDGKCTDIKVDWEHCGGCGKKCAKGQYCANGSCVASCPKATPQACFGGCFDIQSSLKHCGGCGKSCPYGWLCTKGKCHNPNLAEQPPQEKPAEVQPEPAQEQIPEPVEVTLEKDAGSPEVKAELPPEPQPEAKPETLPEQQPKDNCNPQQEICDNKDNDCDGKVDEDFPNKGKACVVKGQLGICRDTVYTCGSQGKLVCEGKATKEVCNGKDDDCDGFVDEGVQKDLECGVGACKRKIKGCNPKDCIPGPKRGLEVCFNNIDDDCNGQVDENCKACSLRTTPSSIWKHPHDKKEVSHILFSPNGGNFVTASKSSALIRIWDVSNDKFTHSKNYQGPSGELVGSIALSQDGTKVAYANDKQQTRIVDAKRARSLGILGLKTGYDQVAFNPKNSNEVAMASRKGTVEIYNVTSKKLTSTLRGGPTVRIHKLSYSPDGKRIALSSNQRELHVWDLTAPSKPSLLRGHTAAVHDFVFHPTKSDILISISEDTTIKFWDMKSISKPASWSKHYGKNQRLAISPNGLLLAVATRDLKHPFSYVDVYTLTWSSTFALPPTYKLLKRLKYIQDPITGLSFHRDNKVLGFSFHSGFGLWEFAKTPRANILGGHSGEILKIRMSPD